MRRVSGRAARVVLAAAILSAGCRTPAQQPAPTEPESWSVTAWTENFEVFPEVEPLVAGVPASAHTHVTILSDFSPMREGRVSAILRRGSEAHEFAGTFRRDGIYGIDIVPSKEGEYDLVFRIQSNGVTEDVPAGRVRVGTAAAPGGSIAGPAPPNGAPRRAVADTGELGFLKEQQWKTPFGTAWVREGQVPAGAAGTARVRAAGGGEALLSAPVDGIVQGSPWPHVGGIVGSGAVVFRVVPSVTQERTLADLQAEVTTLESERLVAQARLDRLQDLLKVEATSRAEVERAQGQVEGLRARLGASRKNLSSAQSSRAGQRRAVDSLPITAPWPGQMAAVLVSPGQVVSAGTVLGRVVKPRPVWLEVALRPEDAARVGARVEGVLLRRPSDPEPNLLSGTGVRVVGRSPELDSRTGTVTVLVEVPLSAAELPVGTTLEAEVLLGGGETAVVVPETALVDDGGTMVVYVQLSGEAFARREVRIRARRGGMAAVEGVEIGERLVTRGGAALRRASLLSTGAPEGHVH